MKWIWWGLLKIQSGHHFCPQKDRRMDRRTDGRTYRQTDRWTRWNQHTLPPFNFVEAGVIMNPQITSLVTRYTVTLDTLIPRQNGLHFPHIFKCIFLNENVWIAMEISLNFVPKGPINNIPTMVQIMAWHRPGDKPLSEPMMVNLLMHMCVIGPHVMKFRKILLRADSLNQIWKIYFRNAKQFNFLCICKWNESYQSIIKYMSTSNSETSH